MKVEVTLQRTEAQRILGKAIVETLAGSVSGLEVRGIEWSAYGTTVTVELATPEPPEERPV